MSSRPLPGVEFATPPVREVAMGFEYEPIAGMGTRELVHLQDAWQGEFVEFSEQVAPSDPLHAGQAHGWSPVQALRLWAAQPSSGRLLQLQSDRIFLNWASVGGGAPYPRYANLRVEFATKWAQQSQRLQDLGLASPAPLVAEFTYVNQISPDEDLVWTDALHIATAEEVPLPGAAGVMQFHMIRTFEGAGNDEAAGEIVVNARQGPTSEPAMMVIVARMQVGDGMDPFTALDRAHEEGSRMFAALTTRAAHERWGMKA